jgi:hypothetical protein
MTENQEEYKIEEQQEKTLTENLLELRNAVTVFFDHGRGLDFEIAILSVSLPLRQARQEEADLEAVVARLTHELERARNFCSVLEGEVVFAGYVVGEDGKKAIDGKNQEQRKTQEAHLVNRDVAVCEVRKAVLEAEDRLTEAQHVLDLSKAVRRYVEDERSALMSVLRWRETEAER